MAFIWLLAAISVHDYYFKIETVHLAERNLLKCRKRA